MQGFERRERDFRRVAERHLLDVLEEQEPGLGVVLHGLEQLALRVEHAHDARDGQHLRLRPLLLRRVPRVVHHDDGRLRDLLGAGVVALDYDVVEQRKKDLPQNCLPGVRPVERERRW